MRSLSSSMTFAVAERDLLSVALSTRARCSVCDETRVFLPKSHACVALLSWQYYLLFCLRRMPLVSFGRRKTWKRWRGCLRGMSTNSSCRTCRLIVWPSRSTRNNANTDPGEERFVFLPAGVLVSTTRTVALDQFVSFFSFSPVINREGTTAITQCCRKDRSVAVGAATPTPPPPARTRSSRGSAANRRWCRARDRTRSKQKPPRERLAMLKNANPGVQLVRYLWSTKALR